MAAEEVEITPEERAEYEATFNLMDKDKNGEVTCFGWFLAEIFLFLNSFFPLSVLDVDNFFAGNIYSRCCVLYAGDS